MSLRAGVIGLGVGEKHLEAYAAHPDCDVVAACDFEAEPRARIAERFPGVRIEEDAGAILGDPGIDVVSVASYDSHHFAQVVRALENGKHVFVEKPVCRTEDEATEIRRTLSAHPELVLSANLPLRLSPRFQFVKRLVDGGELGQLYYLEGDYEYGRLWKLTEGWRGDEEGYSVVLGGAVHLVDLLLWWTGQGVIEVTAKGNGITTRDTKFHQDDFVVAILELADGALAKVSANFGCVRPHYHAVKVFGTKGTFVNGEGDATLYRGQPGDVEPEPVTEAYPGVEKGALIRSFLDAILRGSEPEVTADEALRTIDVCLAIDRSAREGGPVQPRPG